jgi:nucleotide-binding universal stress UspA family protein
MKKILVPTDFSAAAKNAALYAFKLAEQLHTEEIVLYHAYEAPVNIDPMVPTVVMPDIDTLKESSEKALEHFKSVICPFCASTIKINTLARYDHLGSGLDEICKETGAGLIVMGVTGGNLLEEKIIGSNALSVAKNGTVPVIIVPPKAIFTKIEEVMLVCDFNKVVETTPVQPIKQILDATSAKLFVLHVDKENRNWSPDTPFESLMLDTLLDGYHPQYHFENNNNFVEAVNIVVQERMIDLIITIPKKHGLFEGLFHASATKKLAYHSHVPIMVIHE